MGFVSNWPRGRISPSVEDKSKYEKQLIPLGALQLKKAVRKTKIMMASGDYERGPKVEILEQEREANSCRQFRRA